MKRYELSDGTSNKFWQIELKGASVRTQYGRIGTDGKMTVKDFDDEAAGQKEYDKLVQSKVKKGYVAIDGASDAESAPVKKVAKKKVAKKKVAKKKVAKKAAVKKPAGDDGYTRYEFTEEGSNKFWEIKLDGSSVYTRHGRIGSDGRVSLKEFDDDAKAHKEHDKLLASKLKKGYCAA